MPDIQPERIALTINGLRTIIPVNERGCAIWPRGKTRAGYGSARHNGKNVRVHRLSYEQHIDEIPLGQGVHHSCDNTACVNPFHLWVGTQKENLNDAFQKGRKNDRKFSNAEVAEIRDLYAEGYGYKRIAKLFGTHRVMIQRIVKYKHYKEEAPE